MKEVFLCLFLLCMSFLSPATTIVPFKNLGIMATATQAVVYVEVTKKENRLENGFYREYETLHILENIHGPLETGEVFSIKNLHKWNETIETAIWGDLVLEANEKYLLFLQQNDRGEWQPFMLSYGALIEVEKDGKALLAPFDLGAEVHLLKTAQGEYAEPLRVYRKEALLQHLQNIIDGESKWDLEKVIAEPPLQDEVLHERVAAPSHCTYLGAPAPYPRWDGFPTALPVYYTAGGDPGCASSISQIQSAINSMNTNYLGLNMTDGGTHSFTPTCSGMDGATGSEFTTFVDNNYGQRSATIQFEDPCSEITDLTGCSGILAIGGLYWFSSTHTWDGMPWNNAAYGYVVVNNGVGACICSSGSNYEILITHEITHALGIGHIDPVDGTANMNPSCCNTIQSLDIACLDYTYLSALPVELVHFFGKMQNEIVALEWQTASELNNDKFVVERAGKDGIYKTIGTIKGAGNDFGTNHYYFDDADPLTGTNYYRLQQVDFDGSVAFSEQIVVDNFKGLEASVFPNPTKNSVNLAFANPGSGKLIVNIYNAVGQLSAQYLFEKEEEYFEQSMDIQSLPAGIYTVELQFDRQVLSQRLVIPK